MPKRENADDFFEQLSDVQRPHLLALRKLSREADPQAREELKWNVPAYVRGERANLWMLQAFKHHASLRFSTEFFAEHRETVSAAGHETGEGFIKLPYDQELPTQVLQDLMRARLEDYETHGR